MKKRGRLVSAADAGRRASIGRQLPKEPGRWISEKEFASLNERLQVAQSTLEAIQSGAVDAVVVKGASGSQVYSLAGADQRFRVYVEQMQEGAVTASEDGLILYCNRRFAEMVKMPLERVIGGRFAQHFAGDVWPSFPRSLARAGSS